MLQGLQKPRGGRVGQAMVCVGDVRERANQHVHGWQGGMACTCVRADKSRLGPLSIESTWEGCW
jgi:hypothetical protein